MKILNINSFYNKSNINTHTTNTFPYKIKSIGDVVSFSAKQYDSESITNPTNHCAYCGCKVYSEYQLDSIAKEMLSSKYDKLQGKVKSVLEKLEGAKHSEELTLAKRLENEKEIQFFKNFLEIASKKSYLKGAAIFEQVYNLNNDEALALLNENLRPLLKTIDHVSPQNEEKENNNSDINLVEACWCCNHDLKDGTSFVEFYTMYPSIKNNMPSEKFQYAASSLLDSQGNAILQRLSATNLLKTIQRLFIQKKEANTYLDSINFRIKSSKEAIQTAIQTSKEELTVKEEELKQREEQFAQLQQDEEFCSILERLSLQRGIETEDSVISQLRSKSQHISEQINELKNPSKKKTGKNRREKVQGEQLSPEERKEKIEQLKGSYNYIQDQILEHEIQKETQENRIKELNRKYPTIQMLQHEKNKADAIINAHVQLVKIYSELEDKTAQLGKETKLSCLLKDRISQFPEQFDKPDIFPENIQNDYKRYLELREALTFILEHPNGGTINSLIKQSAKGSIEKEIASLKSNPLVVQYIKQQELEQLKSEKSTADKNIENLKKTITALQEDKNRYERLANAMSKEDATKKSTTLSEKIRTTNEKEQQTKLPQIIESIKAEILLINSTIKDLEKKYNEITANF